MRKRIALLLIVSTVILGLSACGNGEKNQTQAGEGQAAEGQADEALDSGGQVSAETETGKEPVELTVFINGLENPSDWEWGQDPSSQKITEDTGVTFKLQYASDIDNTEIMTMLASGEELPDIIVTNAHGAVRPMLVDQGFVQPLNKLADEYCPEFWDVLPADMDKVYQENDGNFYCVVDWYGDENKYNDQILNSRGSVSMTIKKEYLEEIGRPQIKTLDDYQAAIEAIMEKHPEIRNPIWDEDPNNPWNAVSLLNVFARMHGATNNFFDFKDGKVQMVFQADYYKDALKEYNKLYRAGLINPEQYAYKADQKKGIYAAQDLAAFNGYYWNLLEGMNIFDEVVYETIEFPMPEGRTQEQMKIHDDYYAIGTTGVFVTKDTAYPDRCIQYITYMMGLDGQLLQRYGREGVTWEKDEEGRPKSTELKNKVEKEDFAKLQREYGVYNYDFSWFTSQWILAYGAHNTYQDFPAMLPDFEIMTPHQQNERFADLTYTLKDTEALALKEQIYQLWASGVARICTTESDQDFENEYEKFLSDMETAGVETLNTYYQENAEHWKEVGFVME